MGHLSPELERLTEAFAALPEVRAIALGGSRASGRDDEVSDYDVYVYTDAVRAGVAIPLETRQHIVQALGGATVADMGFDYFGDWDEWRSARTGTHFDAVYFELEWMRERVERVMLRHQPSLGYSTAFAFTVSVSHILYDPEGAFAAIQHVGRRPYPDALRSAIVRYNHPLLRGTVSSYWGQLKKAAGRSDLVSLNHRLAALLASYFDIIFAVNGRLHPGEKRLLASALSMCTTLPEGFERDMRVILELAPNGALLLEVLGPCLDALDAWLVREGFADSLQLGPFKTP